MKNMFKWMFATLLLAFFTTGANSQSKKDIFNDPDNYECHTLGVGVDGVKLIKVFAYGKKVDDAIHNAKKAAIHACLFKGVAGQVKVDAIVKDVAATQEKYKDYFDKFFSPTGDFLKYVALSNDGAPSGEDRMKMKGGYKVGIAVAVQYDALRKDMETQGIAKKLGAGF